MGKGNFLGEFEQLVILAILQLGPEAYGLSVRDLIAEKTGRKAGIGSVYATLGRLHDKGWVESAVSKPTPVRGGRAKKTFQVTASGQQSLENSLRMVDAMRSELLPGQDGGRS